MTLPQVSTNLLLYQSALESAISMSSKGHRHIGQESNCFAHSRQNPWWEHGSNVTQAWRSKQSVQASSFTVCFFSISSISCLKNIGVKRTSGYFKRLVANLGSMTFSSGVSFAWSLNAWKSRSRGGNLKGDEPKLNRHCWKDMKLAAAKKPDDAWSNTCNKKLKLSIKN